MTGQKRPPESDLQGSSGAVLDGVYDQNEPARVPVDSLARRDVVAALIAWVETNDATDGDYTLVHNGRTDISGRFPDGRVEE